MVFGVFALMSESDNSFQMKKLWTVYICSDVVNLNQCIENFESVYLL